jgi:hypothetical protein
MGLTVAAVHTPPAYCRIVSSAQNFQQYFRDLKQAGSSLSPIERFVFSLVLANSKTPQTGPATAPHVSNAPGRRT